MKKILCLLIVFSIFMCSVPVFADEATSKEMEDALVAVKQRVDIPEEYTEFTTYSNAYNGDTSYSFMWSDKEYDKSIEISADGDGNIIRYYAFNSLLKNTKKLTSLSKTDIISFGEEFLKGIAPKAFENENDTLMYDEKSWSVNNTSYQLRFTRFRDGVEVKGNNASVTIVVYDDVPFVRSADVLVDYDAEFEAVPENVENYEGTYREAFPVELIYMDRGYNRMTGAEEEKTDLVYRYKNHETGYILAANGEVVTEDTVELYDNSAATGGVMMESAAVAANMKVMLTEAEIKELKAIEGLISQKDAESILKKLPYLKFDGTMKNIHFGVNRFDDLYRISTSYEDGKGRYLSVTFDGKTGEVLNLYNGKGYEAKIDSKKDLESKQTKAKEKIDEFLGIVAKEKIENFDEQSCNVSETAVSKEFERFVNGIRYVDDRISVGFDLQNEMITRYSIDYAEREFPSPETVVDSASAYDLILKIAPLKRIYLKTDGKYKVCFTASERIMLDAFTGEKYLNNLDVNNPSDKDFALLTNHWAAEKVNKLAEIQIGFRDDEFSPDAEIKQYDLLRMFCAGMIHKRYLDYSPQVLYDECVEVYGLLTEDEWNPEGAVTRQQAFEIMIRLAGLEEVAKLKDIFKVEYEDGNLIESEKIGYPAILTGMGVICGNGGKVRPQEDITRAETAVMLYNYLVR